MLRRNRHGFWYVFIVLVQAPLFLSLFCPGMVSATVESEAEKIGNMYNCPGHLRPNVYFTLGNIGYSYVGDESEYAYAKLLNEKGCHKEGDEKYVIFYVSNVNFPSNGIPSGNGKEIEQGWLDYWDYVTKRFSDLDYKIIIHPFPFIVNDQIPNLDYPPGLRPLNRNDLNLNEDEIPVVYECLDGRKTKVASIYDPKTLNMGVEFYGGIKDFFYKYPSFAKISIVPPSDLGEYGFPFGVPGRWWSGSDAVGNCYKIGDEYAPHEYSYENYNGRLNEFRQVLMNEVKALFPDKRYMIYMGYGNDLPEHGFEYEEVVNFAVDNNIDIHSSHASGLDAHEVPLGKIVKNLPNRPEDRPEFTFENTGLLNEFTQLKSLYHASKYRVTGLVLYSGYFFDYLFLAHLLYSMGPSGNPVNYPDKGIQFDGTDNNFNHANNLGSLRSSHFTSGYMDLPTNGDTINGDVENNIFGWGFFEEPYGDIHSYGVMVYAGHLIEDSTYLPDRPLGSPGYHPEYMRLVGSTTTTSERCTGCGDKSRFGLSWEPNLAKGKAVLRIFLVNGDSRIIAEHPYSPMIININSKIEGNAGLVRLNYNYETNDVCDREYRMIGNAINSQAPGQKLHIVILDEYRGRVLVEGETDNSGNFNIWFEVSSEEGEETQFIIPRAYVYVDDRLIALQTNMYSSIPGVAGYPKLTGTFPNTVSNCEWRLVAGEEICNNQDDDLDGVIDDGCDDDGDTFWDKDMTCEGQYRDRAGDIWDCKPEWSDCDDEYPAVKHHCADLDGDGVVDIQDLTIVALDLGKISDFSPVADTDKNGEIDIYDMVFVASRFI